MSSTIEHVARVCSLSNWRGVVMAMLTGAFAVSVQQPEKRFLVMAGFISSAEMWDEFDKQWRHRLNQDGLEYFQMRAFAHSRNQFTGWDTQESRRRSLISDLLEIISAKVWHKFACVIPSESFRSASAETQMALGGHMIAAAAYMIVGGILSWKDHNRYGGNVEYVFEDGDEGRGALVKVIKKEAGVEPLFRPKRDDPAKSISAFTPLQASDIYAYEVKKIVDEIGTPLRHDFTFRFPYMHLDKIPGQPTIFSEKSVQVTEQVLGTSRYFDEHPLNGSE
jgi:hypothetical protein